MPRIGIIGAGIAGLACAGRLRHCGEIMLVDKGHRPGGRLTTVAIGSSSWDLGAPWFTARDPRFRTEVGRWRKAGWVARWSDGPGNAMVGVPAMATLVREQSRRFDVHFEFRVQSLVREDAGWMIQAEGDCVGPFDTVVIAVPAEQAAPLLSLHDLEAAREAASVRSSPCWAVMVEFPHQLDVPTPFATNVDIFSMVACNRSKPERGDGECWILHANSHWSQDHLEWSPPVVAAYLLDAFARLFQIRLPAPTFLKAHRWRFSQPYAQSSRIIWNPGIGLGACGDWCHSPTVEGAWLSGVLLADAMLSQPIDASVNGAVER